LVYRTHQGIYRERLLQEVRPSRNLLVLDRGIGVAGDEQDVDLRLAPAQVVYEFRPAHAGHHDIADQQVDWMPALLKYTDCFFPIRGCQSPISMLLQYHCEEPPHRLFVLHEKYASAAPGWRLGGHLRCHDSFGRRKEDRKRRTAPNFALHGEMARTLAYDSIDCRQPKPGALAYLLSSAQLFATSLVRAR
jgi:hypothetical protein